MFLFPLAPKKTKPTRRLPFAPSSSDEKTESEGSLVSKGVFLFYLPCKGFPSVSNFHQFLGKEKPTVREPRKEILPYVRKEKTAPKTKNITELSFPKKVMPPCLNICFIHLFCFCSLIPNCVGPRSTYQKVIRSTYFTYFSSKGFEITSSAEINHSSFRRRCA